jgi:hypothetical protein
VQRSKQRTTGSSGCNCVLRFFWGRLRRCLLLVDACCCLLLVELVITIANCNWQRRQGHTSQVQGRAAGVRAPYRIYTPVALLEYGPRSPRACVHHSHLDRLLWVSGGCASCARPPEGQSPWAIRFAYGPRPSATALLHWMSDRLFCPIDCISTPRDGDLFCI